MYSEAIDGKDEGRGRVNDVAFRAAKSVELASLQAARSFTYLTLTSSLSAIGFWSQLATAFSVRLLEREVEIGKRLAGLFDLHDNRRTKHSCEKAERAIAGPTIGETAQDLAMAADDAQQPAARIDDARKGVVAAGKGAAQAAVPHDSELLARCTPELVTAVEGNQEIELRAERLVINKQRRQTGTARIRKEIVTQVKSIDVPVSHEELVIERQAVTGDIDIDGEPIGDETIRIPLTEEQVNITKETVVGEEVQIGKRHIADLQNVSDVVRHEELRVDDATTGPATSQGGNHEKLMTTADEAVSALVPMSSSITTADQEHATLDERVRERAYALWEAEGRPEDRPLEYWTKAEREIYAMPTSAMAI